MALYRNGPVMKFCSRGTARMPGLFKVFEGLRGSRAHIPKPSSLQPLCFSACICDRQDSRAASKSVFQGVCQVLQLQRSGFLRRGPRPALECAKAVSTLLYLFDEQKEDANTGLTVSPTLCRGASHKGAMSCTNVSRVKAFHSTQKDCVADSRRIRDTAETVS